MKRMAAKTLKPRNLALRDMEASSSRNRSGAAPVLGPLTFLRHGSEKKRASAERVPFPVRIAHLQDSPPVELPPGQIRPRNRKRKRADVMRKSLKTRLTLNRETLRNLAADEMSGAQGGGVVLITQAATCPS